MKKLVACSLASLTIAAAVFAMARAIPSCLYRPDHMDYYFGSDVTRVYDNLTVPSSSQYRSHVHPLFPLLLAAPTHLLQRARGVDAATAVQLLLALNAAGWTAVLFLLLHQATGRISDSLTLTALASSSAAAVFWLATPESFAFGSTTLLVPFLVFLMPRRGNDPLTHILAGLASVSIVITNWMSGIAASVLKLGWRRAARVGLQVLAALTLIWCAQKLIYRSSRFFLLGSGEEAKYMNDQGLRRTAKIFLYYSFLPPGERFKASTRPDRVGYVVLAELSETGRHERVVTLAGWGLWSVMLALGAGQALRRDCSLRDPRQRAVLLVLAGQFVLHLLYSRETFMLSLHWLPLLVLTVAQACRHPSSRRIVLACAILAIPLVGSRNFQLRNRALAICRPLDALRQDRQSEESPPPRSSAAPGSLAPGLRH